MLRSTWSTVLLVFTTACLATTIPIDPCAAIASKKWILPREARACMSATPVDPRLKANVGEWVLRQAIARLTDRQLVEVVNKTLAFHTSVNYQIQAPEPYLDDVHENLKADLARITQQGYPSDFDLHLDIYRSFKRANDGHCGVYNYCYDCGFLSLSLDQTRDLFHRGIS